MKCDNCGKQHTRMQTEQCMVMALLAFAEHSDRIPAGSALALIGRIDSDAERFWEALDMAIDALRRSGGG